MPLTNQIEVVCTELTSKKIVLEFGQKLHRRSTDFTVYATTFDSLADGYTMCSRLILTKLFRDGLGVENVAFTSPYCMRIMKSAAVPYERIFDQVAAAIREAGMVIARQ